MKRGLSILLVALPAFPQLLYNEQRDKQAQEALKLAGEIQNGAVFQKALDNLDELWKQSQDRVFRNAELQMDANLMVFRTWEDVHRLVLTIRERLGPAQSRALKARQDAFKAQETKTLEALADLKKKLAGAPNAAASVHRLGQAFEDIGQLDDVVSFALDKTGSDAEQADAAKKAEDLLKTLADRYKAFSADLVAQPSVLVLQDKIAELKVEEDHVQRLIAVEQRKQKEIEPIRQLLAEVESGLDKCVPLNKRSDSIEATLQADANLPATSTAAEKECLGTLTYVLINTAALAARNDTPARLALLRSTMEDRANAIRLSAAHTQQIEELISNGVQRLAMFHKGGMKPENVAQFIQALATAGIIPALVLQ